MTTRGGVWILRPTGNLEHLKEDTGSEYYMDPQPMDEKEPNEPVEYKNVADTYTRFAVRDVAD